MEALLRRLGDPRTDSIVALVELVDLIRPPNPRDCEPAQLALRILARLVSEQALMRDSLRNAILDLLRNRKAVSLYVDAGVFPNTGFLSESFRRISHSLLPDVPDMTRLKDVVDALFNRSSDALWVQSIDDSVWLDVLVSLDFSPAQEGRPVPYALGEILESLQVLSYRISALGLEPELVRVDPDLERFGSAFLAQNVEMIAFLERFRVAWLDPEIPIENEQHLQVMLDQCRAVISRIRRRATLNGTSISLTFTLLRLGQNIDRACRLIEVLSVLRRDSTGSALLPVAVGLFKTLVDAECLKNHLSHYWSQNIELLALRVAENAGRKGEPYITESRREYLQLARSALVAGFVIAFMAMFKIFLGSLKLAPLTEALAFCLNYGLGFVFIHIIHGTVATKQPAMTANAIAASIGDGNGRGRDLEALTTLIGRTSRSQIVAIVGNVIMAIPVAIMLSTLVRVLTGSPITPPDKAEALLLEVHPLRSGSLFYAALAGGCLFLSGLIAGYYDNLAAYDRIPERLMHLRWLRRLLGNGLARRAANYIREHLGALAGNFFFGFLLGGSYAIGKLFGIPFDIRHIAFSSAYVGFALEGLDFAPAVDLMVPAMVGVGLIGTLNLTVSFSLALLVALRARQVTFIQRRLLVSSVLSRLRRRPRDFLLPPNA
jgi:site-specific recombinase